MADSAVAITAGSGTNIDTRTEGGNGNHRQVIVLGDPSTNTGVAPVDATAGLKVNLGSDNDVTVTGTVTADLGANNDVTVTSGTVTANLGATDNAVLDSIDTAVNGALDCSGATVPVDLGANNDVTVTGTVDLGATDNAVLDTIATNTGAALTDTELRATPVPISGSVTADLGANNDVTVTGTVDLGDTDNAVLDSIVTATEATQAAVEGTVTVDATGQGDVPITLDGETVTVDLGANNDVTVTGTVDLGATDNAVLDDIATKLGTIDADTGAIKTATETIDNAISGSEMQVDVVASLPAGTNAIGKLAANSGVDIGDVDVTSVPTCLQGAGNPTIDSYANATISASADTANQSLIAAPGASKQIWVYGIQFTVGTGDGSASFQDEDDTAISGVMPFAENSGMAIPSSGNYAMPLWKLETNKALEVDTVTCDIKGSIQYAVVSV